MIGVTLGPYRIDRELGSGGMGVVYRGTGPDGAVVALKVIHPHLVADADALARFRREAEIGISIRHPNVVATLASGESDGRHWLALEYVEGQTLHALQEELGRVPEELCRHVAHEVASGLAAIHAAGIVHRDMKPENVLVTRDNVVKVMDLGVARGAEDDARVTQTGAFVGSLQYAAPEQFAGGGKGLDGRADLHALGVLLYELSTGANPYQDADWRVVFQRVLKESPRRLGAVNPQVSPFFEEVVHTLLAKERDQRFASAAELASVLAAGEDSPWWTSKARSIRGATRRPLRRITIPRETALVGRDAEMAKLRAAFEKAKGGDGQVVLVEGEAGIGKSRLVDEFVALLQREGEDLDFLYGSYPPGGAATASGAFTTAYREHFGSEDLTATLSHVLMQTPLLVPGFAALLTNQAPPAGALALTKDSLQACFVDATRRIAAERVAVVMVDDLHFAPDEGRALFASLAMAAPGHRILLVGTSRPPLDEAWASNIVRIGHTTRLQVGRLGAKDLAALLRDALKSTHLAEELAFRIAEKTDGNPFFVFEVLRGLKDGQYLTQKADGTWATTRVIHEIQIPASIADMVEARVGDLTPGERDILEVAACVGFEFDPSLVAAASGLPLLPTLRTFGQIEKTHRLVRAAGRAYRFDHHQVQEHLYAGMHEQVREQLHATIGDTIEARTGAAASSPATLGGPLCVELCEHFLSGGRGDAALRYLEPARSHLAKCFLHAASVRLTERALAVPGLLAGAERARTLLRLCGAHGPLYLLGRSARQEEAAREAASLAEASGDDELRGSAARALGDAFLTSERPAESVAHYTRSLELALARRDRTAEAAAENGLGSACHRLRRFEDARSHFGRALVAFREAGDRGGEAGAEVNLGLLLLSEKRLAEAEAQLERGVALCREAGQRQYETIGSVNLAQVLAETGRFDAAQALYERQIASAREIGDRKSEAAAAGNLGLLFKTLGRSSVARDRIERVRSIVVERGERRVEAVCLFNLGTVSRNEGDPAAAREHLLAALAVGRETGFRDLASAALVELGELEIECGDVSGAHEHLAEALRLAADQGIAGREVLARALLAQLPGGDLAAAERCFEANDKRLAGVPRWHTLWLLWKAGGDRGRLAEAKRLLDESVAPLGAEDRASVLSNLHLNRRIVASAREQGL